MKRNIVASLLAFTLTFSILAAGCGSESAAANTADTASARTQAVSQEDTQTETQADVQTEIQADAQTETQADIQTKTQADTQTMTQEAENADLTPTAVTASADSGSDIFTDRDLAQEADTSEATTITVTDGQDVSITEKGVYILTGTAAECTVTVNVDKEDKVQLVLDGVSITNTDAPAIYVVSADKVFITTTDSDNSLAVTGTFTADGETNTDAVIFSKDDLVLNGTGSLTISSTDNGIAAKDDFKVTGGIYTITAVSDAIEVNDSVSICDGTFTINTQKDGIHCENDDDNTLGSVYISGGSFTINAGDDGIQATTTLTIDGGTFDITAAEGLEATHVIINDGTITISASDDGINAASKSTAEDVAIEINGGNITITMGQGDTDALDANGDLYINGGTVNITARSPFDYDRNGQLNGGTVIVNGEQVTELTNSMMGPGGMGGGQFGGPGGQSGDSGSFGGRHGGPGRGSMTSSGQTV